MKKLIESANNSSDETANSITYESVNGSIDNNNRNAKRGMI